MRILGLETSCDDTGVAIYDSTDGLLSHKLASQIEIHRPHGGVVPELAARDHIRTLIPLIEAVMSEGQTDHAQLDGVAYTAGPGLIGALLVGTTVGQALAYGWGVPAIGVHHMEGHLLSPQLDQPVEYPFVALLVSGGHTLLAKVRAAGHYEIIGETLDDAVGEAFDKTAKLLGLEYPGGPAISRVGVNGRAGVFKFPRPMTDRPGLAFSFSGLKTAVAQTLAPHIARGELDEQTIADAALAFEQAACETLAIKCRRALQHTHYRRLVVAGGVSANRRLRGLLDALCEETNATVHFPAPQFCTDNGAMIAYAGSVRLRDAHARGSTEQLALSARARWPLDSLETVSASIT